MRVHVATGLSVGLLAGLWTWISAMVGLPTWVAVVSWAGFFAAGGKFTGTAKTAVAGLFGILWGWLAVLGAGLIDGWAGALPVAVAVIAFAMCAKANWRPFSYVPGAFLGAASFFGNDTNLLTTAIAFVVGIALGIVSEWLAGEIVRRTAPAPDAAPSPAPA